MSSVCAIVPAAGSGIRMGGGKPKQFLHLAGKSVLAHTLGALSSAPLISNIFLMVPAAHIPAAEQVVSELDRQGPRAVEISVLAGGAERQDSVYNGLRKLPADCELVLVHDGVRPFVSLGLIEAAIERAHGTGACITAIPSTDTVKRAMEGRVSETVAREEIWLVQTPQVFRKEIILAAYEKAVEEGWRGTDDASFVERIGVAVSIVHGERSNIKLTTPEDLEWGEWFISRGKRNVP